MSTIVSAKGVQIGYTDSQGGWHTAVQRADFTVQKGEKFVIIGPSGCGKTTLLKAIAGFLDISGGELTLNDLPIGEPGPDRAVVFQDFEQLFPWRTVIDNVVYAQRVAKKIPKAQATERARHFLELVGIAHAAEKYPHQLSGGMKQRAAIARALSLEPAILLMDEPFGALDAITRGQLQIEVNEIWKRTGVTILLVTHSIQEAVFLGDHVMVMSKSPAIIREITDTSSAVDMTSAEFNDFSAHLKSLLIAVDAPASSATLAGSAVE